MRASLPVLTLLLLGWAGAASADEIYRWSGELLTPLMTEAEALQLGGFPTVNFSFDAVGAVTPTGFPVPYDQNFSIDYPPFDVSLSISCAGCQVSDLAYAASGGGSVFATVTLPDGTLLSAGGVYDGDSISPYINGPGIWPLTYISGGAFIPVGFVGITDLGPVPEPSSLLLFTLGLLTLALLLRRQSPKRATASPSR
jgi:PEP-CTERM motif-containing protein